MAICEYCERDMLKTDSCNKVVCTIGGKKFVAIPYRDRGFVESVRCHDCGCTEGNYHHLGCDNERCPCCGGQAIGCDCDFADDVEIHVL